MARRAVLFDLDNTLHDRDAGVVAFLRDQHERRRLRMTLEEWTARFVALEEGGRVWKDVVYHRLGEEFGLEQVADELLAEYVDRFADYVRPAEGLGESFGRLRRAGWRTGVITNGSSVLQRRTLDALGIEPWLDVVVVSEECGLRKPDPAIFALALNRLGCGAEGSWFVGDDPVADVEGARHSGMNALWLRRGEPLGEAVERIIMDLCPPAS